MAKLWFSEKQKQVMARNRAYSESPFRPIYGRLQDGRIVEFTEQRCDDSPPNFDDVVFLGEGEYSHNGEAES